MDGEVALRVTSEIRGDINAAADNLLTLVEQGLADLVVWRQGDAEALDRIESGLRAMLETCAFGDIVNQRLGQLDEALTRAGPAGDPLLNGPASPGAGIDQAAADFLMAASPTPFQP